MSETLRESLEATSASMGESAPVEVATEPAPQSTETQAETPAPTSEQSASTTTDGRDEKGRFASKTTAGTSPGQAASTGVPPTPEGAASSTQPPAPAQTTATEPPKPGEPDTTHAPPSWKIGARQAWDKVPPEIRKETWRREVETAQAISRHAPVRQFAEGMQRALSPIAQAIQQRNITPEALVASYAKFDAQLASRDPLVQAQAVAQVIKGYGIPIEALADVLDGKAGGQNQRQPTVEEIRAQVRAEEQAKWQQQQQHHEYKGHTQKVAEFSKTVDPLLFNDDIRADMADIIDAYARRSPPVEISLQEAHNRALRMNPEAWAIVQQREAAKLAATQQGATKRAEAAGSSVKSRPASPVGGGEGRNSLRADLEAAAASLSGRT